ncbi:predicted protein [Histoplasma capsulatum H143]|uniref:Uncharacterized protein n=1 Tax=Ajellomyces capsulatus (strain H143) TaxID=544712 RepID=C6HLG6_AJECH|nr:predicted protein [Histoplasma capsulatum H143]
MTKVTFSSIYLSDHLKKLSITKKLPSMIIQFLSKICVCLLLIKPVFTSPLKSESPSADLPPSLEIDGLTEELPPELIEAISRNATAFLEGFADDPVEPPQYNGESRLALGDRLFASVNLVDANKQKIGSDCGKYGENGVLIDEKNAPYELTSELPYVLLIHSPLESQPVRFQYAGYYWSSHTESGDAHCELGGWDPKSRFWTSCLTPRVRQMDCFFPC